MTRDYKNTRSTKKPERSSSCLVVGLIGLVIGAGIGYAVQLQRAQSLASGPVQIAPPPAPVALQPPEPVGPSYDFYTLLPDLEVKVGDPDKESTGGQAPAEATPIAAKPAPAKGATTTPSELYVLQAGSFRRTAEAETMKANLALLGVESTVQSVNVGDELWHRVFVGPYRDPVYVEKLQKQLKQNQVNTLLVKSAR